jgi:UDP-glucose 4-epimerase
MRAIEVVKYGQFKEYYNIASELMDYSKRQGWATPTLWAPTAGVNNEVIWEWEYETLSDMETDQRKWQTDPGFMDLVRQQAVLVMDGTSRTELLETAYEIA